MWEYLFAISFFIVIGGGIYVTLVGEKFKKAIVRKIYEKLGRKSLEKIILENKIKSKKDLGIEEINRIEKDLSGKDVNQLKSIIINKILTSPKDLITRFILLNTGVLWCVIFRKKFSEMITISAVDRLSLEKAIEDKRFLEELRMMDDKTIDKMKFHRIILNLFILIFIVSVIGIFITEIIPAVKRGIILEREGRSWYMNNID